MQKTGTGDFVREAGRAGRLWSQSRSIFGEEVSRVEKDYREMLRCLRNRALQQEQQFLEEREDMEDYYTKWVHQIKTPISVMRLALREEDTTENVGFSVNSFKSNSMWKWCCTISGWILPAMI